MGSRVILTHDTEDYRYVVTEKWCMCGACEDFHLTVTDLETMESVHIETFSYHEMENGYERFNLAGTVLALAKEIARLKDNKNEQD